MSLINYAADTFLTEGRGAPNTISPGSDGSNWTQTKGNQTASFFAHQGVFTYLNNTNLGVWTYAGLTEADQEVVVNITQQSANNEIAGAVLRCADSSNFYYADIGNSSGNLEIGKDIAGTFTSLGTVAFSSAFGTKYTIRFQAIGTTLRAKIWNALSAEPAPWNLTLTDSSLASGLFGVCLAPNGSSSCTFDTFLATNGDTSSSITSSFGAELRGLTAPANNANLVPATDISAYEMWSLQIDAVATGGTLTFQGSNDNVNFVSVPAYNAAGALVTSSTITGLFWGPRTYRYFRVRQTTWTSGTSSGTLELYNEATDFVMAQNAIQSGTWTVQPGNTANTTAWLQVLGSSYPSGATPITAASGNVANASAVAALAGVSAKTTYITGFEVTGSGSTAGAVVVVTVTGTVTGTLSYIYVGTIGALLANTPLIVAFPKEIPASAVNTAIAVTVPALGTGNTNSAVVAHGYQL